MKIKQWIQPEPLPFSYEEWKSKPFNERVILLCRAWAIQGYGAPPLVYTFYILKILFYIGIWCWFCSFSSDLGTYHNISMWWFKIEALQKAILWSMLFECIGLGCGSGPLTARYFPPFGAFFHCIRPGTIKLPLFPSLLKSDTRNLFDVFLYLVLILSLIRCLTATVITSNLLLPILFVIPVLTFIDKTVYLMARGEHYFIASLCFLFPEEIIPSCKLIWIAIWFWAATSKINRHFPSVIGVMISNSAILRIPWLRKNIYMDYPKDLRPNKLATQLAHIGTITEYTFPLLLLLGDGGILTIIGLIIMVGFHFYITSSVPMAVPLEWNIIMGFGGFVLFYHHASISVLDIQSTALIIILIINLCCFPLLGNLFPQHFSFLVAMRYYAGNWAYSIWLFKKGTEEKLDTYIKKCTLTVKKQLSYFYDEPTTELLISKVIAFRAMHLHGKILQHIIPKMVNNIDEYEWRDGELVAGVVLGWNFGEGHLHNEQLVEAVQRRCNFESEELRCLFVEAQPLGNPNLSWRIYDAKTGILQKGTNCVKELCLLQPWNAK